MQQFTYIGRSILNIHSPKLNNEEAFITAINNVCAAIKIYDGYYEIQFVNVNDNEEYEDERIPFLDKLLEKPERYPLAAKYLVACTQRLKEDKFLFEDACPLGSYVAYKLVLADKYFLPFYTDLLSLWDMNHEVEEFEYIEEIVMHHGWCKEIEDIIVIRSSIACGQSGFEQLVRFENFIRKHNEPLEDSPFFIRLVEAVIKEYGSSVWSDIANEQKAKNIFGGMANEAIKVRVMLDEKESAC